MSFFLVPSTFVTKWRSFFIFWIFGDFCKRRNGQGFGALDYEWRGLGSIVNLVSTPRSRNGCWKSVWKPGKHLEITYNKVGSQLMPVAWCYGKREEHGMWAYFCAFVSLQITNLRFLQVLVKGNYPVKINSPYMPKESIWRKEIYDALTMAAELDSITWSSLCTSAVKFGRSSGFSIQQSVIMAYLSINTMICWLWLTI